MIIIDVILILSVAAGLVYMYKLRRAIMVVHQSRIELKQLMSQFAFDIDRAEKALAQIKQIGKQQMEELQQTSKKALNLHDDLEFLMHRGEDIADRLEVSAHHGNKKLQVNEHKKGTQKVKTTVNLEGLR
ncbi:MAG: hypothetical protein K0U39_02925 [Alphaproteobacteria bacterium]|nr:hypothetical protein [Alphaproteobacteria bacterium]